MFTRSYSRRQPFTGAQLSMITCIASEQHERPDQPMWSVRALPALGQLVARSNFSQVPMAVRLAISGLAPAFSAVT